MSTSTYSNDGPECPYCGCQFVADETYYHDPSFTKMDCDECGKPFKVEVRHSVSWRCDAISAPAARHAKENIGHPTDGATSGRPSPD